MRHQISQSLETLAQIRGPGRQVNPRRGTQGNHKAGSSPNKAAKYNEDLMTTMAQVSGGQFYDADAPERFPAIFESELEGLQKLTVQNLRVCLRRLDFCESLNPLGN